MGVVTRSWGVPSRTCSTGGVGWGEVLRWGTDCVHFQTADPLLFLLLFKSNVMFPSDEMVIKLKSVLFCSFIELLPRVLKAVDDHQSLQMSHQHLIVTNTKHDFRCIRLHYKDSATRLVPCISNCGSRGRMLCRDRFSFFLRMLRPLPAAWRRRDGDDTKKREGKQENTFLGENSGNLTNSQIVRKESLCGSAVEDQLRERFSGKCPGGKTSRIFGVYCSSPSPLKLSYPCGRPT